MTKTGYLKRYRHPAVTIRAAVLLHIYLPSRIVVFLLFVLFRCQVSHKTVCKWTKTFASEIVLPDYQPTSDILICHVDEKYVKVNGEWQYWWTIKDCFGNPIHAIVTPFRDYESAKKLFIEARRKIGRTVDIVVRDGLSAYDRAVKFLGRKCKSVVAGIQGKGFIHKRQFYWLTNNPSESLNAEIDFYLGKFRKNFSSTESANLFAQVFMLQKYLKKNINERKLLEASSILERALCI
jgi:transposase-like protein